MLLSDYKYLIVLEKSETGSSAYSPDLVVCVATRATLEETTEQKGLIC